MRLSPLVLNKMRGDLSVMSFETGDVLSRHSNGPSVGCRAIYDQRGTAVLNQGEQSSIYLIGRQT